MPLLRLFVLFCNTDEAPGGKSFNMFTVLKSVEGAGLAFSHLLGATMQRGVLNFPQPSCEVGGVAPWRSRIQDAPRSWVPSEAATAMGGVVSWWRWLFCMVRGVVSRWVSYKVLLTGGLTMFLFFCGRWVGEPIFGLETIWDRGKWRRPLGRAFQPGQASSRVQPVGKQDIVCCGFFTGFGAAFGHFGKHEKAWRASMGWFVVYVALQRRCDDLFRDQMVTCLGFLSVGLCSEDKKVGTVG